MRILGIDPGTAITGYGVIETDGRRLSLVSAGAIRLRGVPEEGGRLRQAAESLAAVIAEHIPDEASLERVFHHANVRSALVLSQMRGAILLELARAGLPVHEYTALQVKKALVGYGRAQKEQVRQMTQRLLAPALVPPPHDLSDALALAICHAHTSAGQRRYPCAPARR